MEYRRLTKGHEPLASDWCQNVHIVSIDGTNSVIYIPNRLI
jgi:hypothetical protein